MASLSPEEQARCERNRLAALAKRQQKKTKQSTLASFWSGGGGGGAKAKAAQADPVAEPRASKKRAASGEAKPARSSSGGSDSSKRRRATTTTWDEDEPPSPVAKTPPSRPGSADGSRDAAAPTPTPGHNGEASPSSRARRSKKRVQYFDSDEEDDANGDEADPAAPSSGPNSSPASASGSGSGGSSGSSSGRLKKRSLRRIADSDSEDEYVPDEAEVASAQADEMEALEELKQSAVVPDTAAASDDEPEEPEQATKARRAPASKPKAARKLNQAFPSSGPRHYKAGSLTGSKKEKNEERYSFLLHQKDSNQRVPTDPEYDPTTLHIPSHFFNKFSPFERQYWNIKRKFWDTILFFKKGKFYELYEKDAGIGHQHFDLKLTDRVNMKMVGVPQATFTAWAQRFLGLGYKVAKVDEVESGLAKQMREKKTKTSSSSKIIERKLAQVLTKGTLMGDFLVGDMSSYIMSIKEDPESCSYGVCFADTGTSEFNLCDFEDDSMRTKLETLLVQTKPKEVVLEKGNLSKISRALLRQLLPSASITVLPAGTEEGSFWDTYTTENRLDTLGYFQAASGAAGEGRDGEAAAGAQAAREAWPVVLRERSDSSPLLLSAFGGLVSYFSTLLIDRQLLSAGNFVVYDPLKHGHCLMLDGQTLSNLEILNNTVDDSEEGTLFKLLCHCTTAFGKRLFRKWLCHPLRAVADIQARLSAGDDLSNGGDVQPILKLALKGLPDIERLIAKVHGGTCKLNDFLLLVNSLEAVTTLLADLGSYLDGLSSARLRRLLQWRPDGGLLEDYRPALDALNKAFSIEDITDTVTPKPGTMPDYDEAVATSGKIEKQLKAHLQEVRLKFGSKWKAKVNYKHPGVSKEKYQIEVPAAAASSVPKDWVLKSSTKTLKRYWSPFVASVQQELAEAKETQQQALSHTYSAMLAQFDENIALYNSAVVCLAEVDCLMSLGAARAVMGEPMCRPEFVEAEQGPDGARSPVLEVDDLRHPCLVQSGAVSDYIPNDAHLGGPGSPAVMVLTGPNMGGKSTLLRQTCIGVIMAQLGCHVPAERFRLSPVDRIFTRIGANDNIMAGQSTFMVELKETANILNQATPDSLVILDELGRGTSTFDGYAIAYSVLTQIANEIGCRCMFATHYHLLTDEFAKHPGVAMQHMACVVDPDGRDVTFLYKLSPGVCSKSYGMNVAGMAGVPKAIVLAAERKAQEYEASSWFGKLVSSHSKAEKVEQFQQVLALCAAQDAAGLQAALASNTEL